MNRTTRLVLLCFSIVLAAFALRLFLLLTCFTGLHADDAFPGLIAVHILKGVFPNLQWEYQYGGAFFSYLAAANLKLFGISILSFKLTTFPLLLVNMFFTCKLAARLHGRATGLLTGLLFAISPMFVTLFTVDRTNYHDTFAFGALILYLTDSMSRRAPADKRMAPYAFLGFVSGFAFWVFPLIVPYILTSWAILFRTKEQRNFAKFFWLITFGIIGSALLIVYNIQHPFATCLSLGGRPVGASRASFHSSVASWGLLQTLWRYAVGYVRDFPSSVMHVCTHVLSVFCAVNPLTQNGGPLAFAVCAVYLAPVAYYAVRMRGTGWTKIPLYLAAFSVLFALFGFMDSPRYLLPLWPAAAILLAASLVDIGKKNRPLAICLLTFVLSVNLAGALLCSQVKSPPYQKLADYLTSKNLRWGYSGYWEAYPIIFLSKENIIVSPTLDLGSVHPKSKDAYPFYTNTVDNKDSVFYITNDKQASVDLFTKKMTELHVRFKGDLLPPFMIYHSFSKRVYPADLALPQSASDVEEPLFY